VGSSLLDSSVIDVLQAQPRPPGCIVSPSFRPSDIARFRRLGLSPVRSDASTFLARAAQIAAG